MGCLLGLSEFPFHLCPFVELEMDNQPKLAFRVHGLVSVGNILVTMGKKQTSRRLWSCRIRNKCNSRRLWSFLFCQKNKLYTYIYIVFFYDIYIKI